MAKLCGHLVCFLSRVLRLYEKTYCFPQVNIGGCLDPMGIHRVRLYCGRLVHGYAATFPIWSHFLTTSFRRRHILDA